MIIANGQEMRAMLAEARAKVFPPKKVSDQLYEMVLDALCLLQEHCPPDGYWLGFSGGKDSCVIKRLCEMAGVKFEAWYSNVTIDPPELVRFIKEHHKDVQWNQPKMAMMSRVASRPALPPTRAMRWCCSEYKENGGNGRVKVFGVRKAESTARAKRWTDVAKDMHGNKAICPIVDWTDEQVWEFLRGYEVPYCKLYDEGWTRLGCVGCPLATKERQDEEFTRWPKYEENWKKAIYKNWETYHDRLKVRGEHAGKPYFHARFRTAEDMWLWWRERKKPDYWTQEEADVVVPPSEIVPEPCQKELLVTNH